MKLKTHKALSKRLKITKNGKILKRYCGQDHFNSRDKSKITRKKRRDTVMSNAHSRAVKALMPNQ